MMRPESAIDFPSKNFPLYLSFYRQNPSDFAVCGVQIEIVGELWGFPCVVIMAEFIFVYIAYC